MIITAKRVLELREEHGMIHNLSDREMNEPEGVGLEVRMKKAYKLVSDGFLGVETRDTPDHKSVGLDSGEYLELDPGDYYLVETVESIDVPGNQIKIGGKKTHLMPDVYPRSTLQRSGIYFKGTNTNPGYEGTLTFGLKNVSDQQFRLQQGARIAEVVFKQAIGGLVREYEGQWQGGRVSTEGEEEQI
jgi:deoxycytidine triphosphate deaminase